MALLTPYGKLANQWADTATTYAQPTSNIKHDRPNIW